MAEVLRSGFAEGLPCQRGTFRPKSAALLLILGSSLFIHGLSAAGQSAQPPQARKASPGANPPATEPTTPAPPPAPVVLPPEQTPAHAPVIAWDGQLLTVDAENSSLSDVLLGIRSRSGASIEMPASTSRERIAVHLGPAPIREVLSSLLYGTNFNYVIQSAEDHDGTVGKIVLTARDGDQSGDAAEGDTVAVDARTNPKKRLMPGYAAPGKRDFEVAHANAVDDGASTAADPAFPDSPSPSPDQTAAATDSNATNPADTLSATAKATDNTPSTDATTLTAAEQSNSGNAAGTVAGNGALPSSAAGSSALSQTEQNLQRMYQQRQQLQAQQGHAAQTPAP